MLICIRWYFNEREGNGISPEMSGVFGPFVDRKTADEWIKIQPTWGGWGEYEYQIENLINVKLATEEKPL